MQFGMLLSAAVDSGDYVSIPKTLAVVVVLLVWARVLTWIDKDAPAAHLPREVINSGLLASGVLGLLLFFLLPGFLLAYAVLCVLAAGGIGAYLGVRQQRVGLDDIKKDLATWMKNPFGPKAPKAAGPGQVTIFTRSGSPMPVPEAETPERLPYDGAQELLTDPLRKGAERIEVRPAEGAAAVQFVVDGVAYSAPTMDRSVAAETITYLKRAAGLDINDRRKPQTGPIRAALDGKRRDVQVTTAGSTAGESLRLVVEPKKIHDRKLDALGMEPFQLELIQQSIAENKGIVLVAAPRGQGLTSLMYGIIRAHDAFLSHIQTIEHNPPADLEGITQNKLTPAATAVEELKLVEWVASQQPDAILIDQIDNPASARELIRYVGEGRRLYVGLRAGSTFDAVSAWRKLVGDDHLALKHLKMAICGRVIRKLCNACKLAYAPDPETLRKLNMDHGRVTTLYQARTQPLRDAKGNQIFCDFCHELHYVGRCGIYELLVVDEDVRQAVVSGGSINQFKTAFRKQRGRYLQDVALAKVEVGETSVQEVLRVLRAEERPAASSQKPSGAPAKG